MTTTLREAAAARAGGGPAPAFGAADWLCLAATPTFAIMALLTAMSGGGMPDMVCSADGMGSPVGGMAPMYLLMSAFHLVPWLRLVAGWRRQAGRSPSMSGTG